MVFLRKNAEKIEALERGFPYSYYTPNEILGEVYGQRMYPKEALWALETRARAYIGVMNRLPYALYELWVRLKEVERVIEELKAAFPEIEALPSPAPDTQPPELPPVINAVLKERLLNETPVNGKYLKTGDKKDSDIIEWIFDYSGYGDSLTVDLYMQYIQTSCKTTTIQDYITRKKKTPD